MSCPYLLAGIGVPALQQAQVANLRYRPSSGMANGSYHGTTRTES
jgi:hypothetical protein